MIAISRELWESFGGTLDETNTSRLRNTQVSQTLLVKTLRQANG
jgi:hypothetical protein